MRDFFKRMFCKHEWDEDESFLGIMEGAKYYCVHKKCKKCNKQATEIYHIP